MQDTSIKFGTVEATAIMDDKGSTATVTGKYRNSELDYCKVTYKIRHRTDTTSIDKLADIAYTNSTHSERFDTGYFVEPIGKDGKDMYLVEQYSVLHPIDGTVRQLFLSLL